jgi:pimeloyl-ACP methyl ester carboxylesterase
MIMLKLVLGSALAAYAGSVALLYVMQRDLLYRPRQTVRTSPTAAGFSAAEEIVLDTADGEKVIAWHVPPQAGKPVVVFLHGNGDVLATRVPRFRAVIEDGTGLLALSYRGYGGSTGNPTETGRRWRTGAVASRLLKNANAAWLAQKWHQRCHKLARRRSKNPEQYLTKEQQKACLDSAAVELIREITQQRPLN